MRIAFRIDTYTHNLYRMIIHNRYIQAYTLYRIIHNRYIYVLYTGLYKERKNFFLNNEQRSRDAAAKKRANTSGVGKINNYYEDIYIPPYSNTH